jgi:hypothetical protein
MSEEKKKMKTFTNMQAVFCALYVLVLLFHSLIYYIKIQILNTFFMYYLPSLHSCAPLYLL